MQMRAFSIYIWVGADTNIQLAQPENVTKQPMESVRAYTTPP